MRGATPPALYASRPALFIAVVKNREKDVRRLAPAFDSFHIARASLRRDNYELCSAAAAAFKEAMDSMRFSWYNVLLTR